MPAASVRDRSQLLVSARQGDQERLGELLQSYRNYLYLVARTQVDLHLAARVNPSDIVQETFLQAYRGFQQFRGQSQSELVSWLRRILVNTIVAAFDKHLGTQKRDARRECSLEAFTRQLDRSSVHIDAALASQGTSPSLAAERHELAALVADRLAELPPQYREVIVLRNLEGLTFEQISAGMNCTREAARKLWVRAIGRLRLDPDQEL